MTCLDSLFYIFNSSAVSKSSYTKIFYICRICPYMIEAVQRLPYRDIFWIQRSMSAIFDQTRTNCHEKITKLKIFSRFKGKEVEYRTQYNSNICHGYFTNAAKDGKNIKFKSNQVKLYFWHQNS